MKQVYYIFLAILISLFPRSAQAAILIRATDGNTPFNLLTYYDLSSVATLFGGGLPPGVTQFQDQNDPFPQAIFAAPISDSTHASENYSRPTGNGLSAASGSCSTGTTFNTTGFGPQVFGVSFSLSASGGPSQNLSESATSTVTVRAQFTVDQTTPFTISTVNGASFVFTSPSPAPDAFSFNLNTPNTSFSGILDAGFTYNIDVSATDSIGSVPSNPAEDFTLSVPEPASTSLAAIAAIGFVARRRQPTSR